MFLLLGFYGFVLFLQDFCKTLCYLITAGQQWVSEVHHTAVRLVYCLFVYVCVCVCLFSCCFAIQTELKHMDTDWLTTGTKKEEREDEKMNDGEREESRERQMGVKGEETDRGEEEKKQGKNRDS